MGVCLYVCVYTCVCVVVEEREIYTEQLDHLVLGDKDLHNLPFTQLESQKRSSFYFCTSLKAREDPGNLSPGADGCPSSKLSSKEGVEQCSFSLDSSLSTV